MIFKFLMFHNSFILWWYWNFQINFSCLFQIKFYTSIHLWTKFVSIIIAWPSTCDVPKKLRMARTTMELEDLCYMQVLCLHSRYIHCAYWANVFFKRLEQQLDIFPCTCCTQLQVREPVKFKHITRQWMRNKNGLYK